MADSNLLNGVEAVDAQVSPPALPKARIEQIRQHLDQGWFEINGETAVRELLDEVARLEAIVGDYRIILELVSGS